MTSGLPGDRALMGDAYERARLVWNGTIDHRPAVLVRPRSTAEVAAALADASKRGLPISIRGGGHDWAGRGARDGAYTIDMRDLGTVRIDDHVATVGGGATAEDVLDAARAHGLAAALGTVDSVGVAGLVLGGGYSPLIGLAGLGVDTVVSAEIVLADGRIVVASPECEPELFWAVRGGGGNFGVVTSVSLRLFPVAQVTAGTIAFGWPQARRILQGLQTLHRELDDAFDVMFGAMHTPAGQVLFTSPVWAGPEVDAGVHLDRVRALGDPILDDVERRDLADLARTVGAAFPAGAHYRLGSRITPPIDDAFVDAFIACGDSMPAGSALNVHHSHGAATRLPVSETAYAYREEHLVVELLGMWTDGDGVAECGWVSKAEDRFDACALPGGWANLMAADDPRALDAFGSNTSRLLAAKKHYDPTGVFDATPLPASRPENRPSH